MSGRRLLLLLLPLTVPVMTALQNGGRTVAAAGDTPTPTPVPTSTPVPGPAGPALLAAMEQALKHAGSVHIIETGNLTIPSAPDQNQTLAGTVDVSSKHHLLHSVLVNHFAGGQPDARSVVIAVGKHDATRSGQVGKTAKWKCPRQKVVAGTYDAAQLPRQVDGATTVGAESLTGVSVWHVHLPETSSAGTIDADFYIGQSDNLLLRETLRLTVGSGTDQATATLDLNYSQYGKAFKLKLPAVCGRR